MSDFSVHELLKDTILSLVSDEPAPTFLIYEEAAQSLSDLAFSHDQFSDAVGCLVDNKFLTLEDNDGVLELTLVENNTPPRLDVN